VRNIHDAPCQNPKCSLPNYHHPAEQRYQRVHHARSVCTMAAGIRRIMWLSTIILGNERDAQSFPLLTMECKSFIHLNTELWHSTWRALEQHSVDVFWFGYVVWVILILCQTIEDLQLGWSWWKWSPWWLLHPVAILLPIPCGNFNACWARVNQHPPEHLEGWMISGQETVQFSVGFQFLS
jgi:hypothetical protein